MTAEKDLSNLLSNINPVLNDGEYVFVSIPEENIPDGISCIGRFSEKEGETIIMNKVEADQFGYSYEYVASWITLNVHSSLHAVGFTAAISSALAKHHISCNVIAAYYHDHLFVDEKDGEKAMGVLKELKTNVSLKF